MSSDMTQLGFDALLQKAYQDNEARAFERDCAHLPSTWTEALAYHQKQISQHHAAMLDTDFEAALAIRKDAHLLAKKLNGGAGGILASNDAPGCKLDKAARAEAGAVPLWGQSGVFEVAAAGLTSRVEMNGVFGIGATARMYLGFSVRAVDKSKPFLSTTGYRSFLGASVPTERDMTSERFVRRVIEVFVDQDLRGKLVLIDPKYST